jgi:hypothetical protein
MEIIIKSKKEYYQVMVSIYTLMNKGEKKLTKPELSKLEVMTRAAEDFEKNTNALLKCYSK